MPDSQLTKRFLEAVEGLNLKFPVADLAKKTGYKSSSISPFLNGKRGVSDDFLRKFCEVFELDYDYIRFGRILDASEKSIRKPKIETNPEQEGIIYVPISAQAGYSKHYLNPVFVKSLQKIFIPGMPYRGDKYRIFEVDGESMEPTLKHGYHVLGELIEKDSYAQVPNYYVYVIVTEDRVMLKRLYRKSNSEFVAISDNEEFFPQFGLHMGDIKELWLVKRKMDWEMAPPKKFEIHI